MDAIVLDAHLGDTKDDVIKALAERVEFIGRSGDAQHLISDILARENQTPTGLPGGIAIPHCRSDAVAFPTIVIARLATPVYFGAPDGPADLIFLLATPTDGLISHTKLLSRLARALVHDDVLRALRSADTPEEVSHLLSTLLGNSGPILPPVPTYAQKIHVLAVTGCPTGIAHTFMAAESLERAVDEHFPHVDLNVETQGAQDCAQLPPSSIDQADVVIFASDVAIVERERFATVPSISVGVRQALNSPDTVIQQALDLAKLSRGNKKTTPSTTTIVRPHRDRNAFAASIPTSPRGRLAAVGQAVMTGVSYMIPFIAAGGLLIALSFLIGGYDVGHVAHQIISNYNLGNLPGSLSYILDSDVPLHNTTHRSGALLYTGAVLYTLGQLSMQFVVPVLSGYVAYGLGGRPAIAPGFVGGAVSMLLGAGFLGGLITGLLAGFIIVLLRLIPVPQWLENLMPVVILPFIGSLLVGTIMVLLLGEPVAWLMSELQQGLESMSHTSAIALGIIIGIMMCADLGGPINKSAYLFATMGLASQSLASFQIMAAAMAAGMVPPLGLALASTLRRSLFSVNEQHNSKAAWLLGLSFITEGAVPFAAADPLRVLPSSVLGGAVAGGLSMALDVGCRAPHGGVFVLFAMDNPLGFLVALLAGTVTTALTVIFAKSLLRRSPTTT